MEVALYVADENGNIKLDKNGKKEMLADLYTLEEEYQIWQMQNWKQFDYQMITNEELTQH